MGKIQKICNEKIIGVLKNTTRQYLAGKLSKPQELQYFEEDRAEIGISSYEDFSYELPHSHTKAREYMYLISGFTEYKDIDSKEVFKFKTGDFYQILPETKYAQRSKPGTKILFIKVPAGNDKINIQPDRELMSWLEEHINPVRKDYIDDPYAPKPNSIHPAAAVAITNRENEILLIRRQDSGNWSLPGGTQNLGENLATCAIREVFEETGLEVKIIDIIGIYTNPKTVIEYSDGEVRQEFLILFLGSIQKGTLKLDTIESSEYCWIKLSKSISLQMTEPQKQRLKDIIDFQKNSYRVIR